jgi:hypothetical protein
VIASDGVGNLTVAWTSENQDGDRGGLYAQRYGGLVPTGLRADTAGNSLVEPGETVDVRPTWRNVNGSALAFASTWAGGSGPVGGLPTVVDGTADYGIVSHDASAECSDCYAFAVPAPSPRPIAHWDFSFLERITPAVQGQEIRWKVHVGDSFTDVPPSNGFYRFVETILHRNVTAGCAPTAYCPDGATTRDQMAVFVLAAREPAGYAPTACGAQMFADVPASSAYCPWIEELARRGVVGGCGGGNYCPSSGATRDQMAVFVLRTLDPALQPPACTTPVFADVPASNGFCRWIEELFRRGVVTGCGGGNYCPAAAVSRGEMAVFLAATFGLTLYGP